ncbi:Fe(3+)-hydroxamate ABC transporter permease FhuB [Rhizobium lusitanum]|nr:Fe(3+)-hydroxamate ABC transporter permease FhuB [Rhizobium lusitanum]
MVVSDRRDQTPVRAALTMAAAALVLSVLSLSRLLPLPLALKALFDPDLADLRQVVVYYAWFPRLSVSLLCGLGLALSGCVFQQVLRNPLAEPTTLGISAGSQLALTLATLFMPSLLILGTETIAVSGAILAACLIAALAWRRTLSPTGLILGGLMMSLYAGTFAAVLAQLFGSALGNVYIWSSGSLNQNDWETLRYLAPRLAVAAFAIAVIASPLTILALDDEAARSLGLRLRAIRLLAMAPATAIAGFIVASVGVVGFIGLAAPTLARLMGARRFKDQLIWAPVFGALLLWLTDQLVQLIADLGWRVPTGTATAMIGAPLLLWLLPRMEQDLPAKGASSQRTPRPQILIYTILALLALALLPALDLARSFDGWRFDTWNDLCGLLSLRAPRVAAALSAGALLAVAGTLMQHLTGNVMASPEVLGISSGASLAALLLLLILPSPGGGMLFLAASVGAFATLFVTLLTGRRSAFSPQRMLLTGLALGTVVSALTSFLMAGDNPRLRSAISWLSGSTYRVDAGQALWLAAMPLLIFMLLPFMRRWLQILPLGETSTKAIGVNIGLARLVLLIVAGVSTASATLVVGPLSFVGLLAPHMARMLGLQRPMAQIVCAAILGALIMVIADWFGRNAVFPSQIPAGLLATFIGGPYFFWLMRKAAL